MIALAMVVSAREVIFRSHFAWIDDRRAKEDVSFGLAFIKSIVLITERIIFFANASL